MRNLKGNNLRTVLLAILVGFVVLPTLVRAVDYNVGVRVGDWIKYGQYKVTWSGNGSEPSYITDEKKVDWMRIDVENISGTTVTLNLTTHYNNGTQIPQNSSIDVTGNFGYFIIASNLKSGDNVINQANFPTINQTTTAMYAGASRNVNLLETTSVYGNQTTTGKVYWDQSTGVMVEMYSKTPDSSNLGAYIGTSVKATETNMWSADSAHEVVTLSNNLISIIIAAITVIIASVAATIVFLRRKPSSPQQPPQPP